MSLHPDIQRLLRAFEIRRRILLLLRGLLCAGTALFFGTVFAVLIDAPLVLEDEWRLALAGMVYGAVLTAFSWSALRRFKLGSRVDVAAALEAVAPRLRGSFLAAVELEPSAGDVDSTPFRQALQDRTAEMIRGTSVRVLLPFGMLRRDGLFLLFGVLVIGGGFAINGTRFGWQCARALLPLANFERLADAKITILQPAPVEGVVPADEPLQIEVEVVAPGEVEPLLIARRANGSKVRIPMRAAGPGRFAADLPVEREPLVYQVRASYSLTRRLQLEPRLRPRVASYSLAYHYPEYTGLADWTVTASEGAVSGLEGTVVDVALLPDQAVLSGSLALTMGRNQRELPLEAAQKEGEGGWLRARFELTEGGAYTVRLLSAETGLKSAPGPQNTIQIELDAPPKLVLDRPVQDMVVPLGEQVVLEGSAGDDFGLVRVELEFRRNESAWNHAVLATSTGREFPIRTPFDPLAQKARPGDVWSVRFSATDARGQRGESRTLRLAIAQPGTVARPDRALAAQRSLYKRVKELASESAEAVAALEKLKSQTERGAPDDLKAGEALVRAEQSLEKAVQAAEAARESLRDVQEEAATGAPQEEAALRQEAHVLAAAQFGDLQMSLQALQQLRPMATNKAASVEAARFAHEAAAAGAALARLVEESARTRLDVLEASSLTPAARALSAELAAHQRESVSNPDASTEVLPDGEALRRQQVSQTLSSQLQGQLQKLAERAQPVAAALRPALEELRKNQAAAEKAVQAASSGEGTPVAASPSVAAAALAKSLDRSATSLEAAKPALKAAAERAQSALARAERSGAETLERSAREIGALAHKQSLPAELREAEASIRAAAAADVLRANAEAESVDENASPKLARAMVLAAAALETPRDVNPGVGALVAQAADLAKALKPLEASAATEKVSRKTEGLAARIDRQNGPASPEQMYERKQLKEATQALARQIREARLPEVAANATREAGDALGGSVPAGLAKAAEALKTAAEASVEMAEKALAEIIKKAPSLAQQMDRLAAKASRDSEANAALAKKSADGAAQQEGQRELTGAIKAEADFERKLDQLRQALRTEANAQDVRTAAGREAARDADGAASQLRDLGTRAQVALQQAAARMAERQPLIERAAAFQKQGAEQLRSLADNYQKLVSADPGERAAARQALRAADKAAGEGMKLDSREQRLEELASLADMAKKSPEEALAKAQAMEAAGSKGSSEKPSASGDASGEGAPSLETGAKSGSPAQSGKSKGARGEADGASTLAQAAQADVAEARAALQEGGEKGAERAAQALSSALDAQATADRGERSQEAVATVPGASSSAGLSGMADTGLSGLPPGKSGGTGEWGNLPKRLATDLVEGRRETAPVEYREAVEAYFRAVAERARVGAAR